MSKINLDVFVAEIDLNVAELFTKLTAIPMCHVHVYLHVRWYLQRGRSRAFLMKLNVECMSMFNSSTAAVQCSV